MTTEPSQISLRLSGRRVGDAQRDECAELLADAFVRGELSPAEYDTRTGVCLAAVTDVDLARLTHDLPAQAPTPTTSPGDLAKNEPEVTPVSPVRFVALQAFLIIVAYGAGINLESEMYAWYVVAFQIWFVGTVASVTGAFLLRPNAVALEAAWQRVWSRR